MYYEKSNNHESRQAYCPYHMERIIGGTLTNPQGKFIPNATVVLYVSYIDKCHDKVTKRLAYTTTDDSGSFSFTVDLSKYIISKFIVQAFKPLNII